MFTPVGYVLLEQVGRSEDVVGVRLPLLFEKTLEQLQELHGELVADSLQLQTVIDTVSKFVDEKLQEQIGVQNEQAAADAQPEAEQHAEAAAEQNLEEQKKTPEGAHHEDCSIIIVVLSKRSMHPQFQSSAYGSKSLTILWGDISSVDVFLSRYLLVFTTVGGLLQAGMGILAF